MIFIIISCFDMLSIGICDANYEYCRHIEDCVKALFSPKNILSSFHLFDSAEKFSFWVETEETGLDIAFLTVEPDDLRAIDFAKDLNRLYPACQILFLSSDVLVASELYEAEHVWFIQKERISQYLDRALAKCLTFLSERRTTTPGILIREQGKTVLLPLPEILYISKVGRKSMVRCRERDYFDARNPAKLIPGLYKEHFIRCHQGYWVNLSKIRELDHEEFVLEDGSRVPIGRVFRMSARQRFLEQYSV